MENFIRDRINSIIETFIDVVSINHGIDKELLIKSLNDSLDIKTVEKKTVKKTVVSAVKKTTVDYTTLTKKELQEICRSKSLTVGGTKDEIIQRIILINGANTTKTPSPSPSPSPINPKKSIKKIVKIAKTELTMSKPNKFSHVINKETGLVFDVKSNMIIGREDGKNITPLTKDDINLCNKYKLQYQLPLNLNDEDDEEDVEDAEDEEDVDVDDDDDEVDDDMFDIEDDELDASMF